MKKQAILNIKNAALAFGALLMSAGFVACSDKDAPDPGEPGEEGIETVVGSSVSVNSDADDLTSKYVTNYKRPGSRAVADVTRPEAPEWSMPELPASTEGMIKVEKSQWSGWGGLDGGENFYVAASDDLTFEGLNANNNVNLYIYGTLTVPSFAPAQGANIYIAPGGSLTLTGTDWDKNPGVLKDDKSTNLYIYDGGEYVGSYTSASKTGLYVEGDVNVGTAEFGGKVYVAGTLTADALTTNNATFYAENVVADSWTYNNDSNVYVDSDINIEGNVTINAQNVTIDCQNYIVGGKFHMENNSVLKAYEHINVAGDAEVSTQGTVYTPCLYVANKLYIKNSATLNIPNKIYCGDFEASASGFTINMDGNALIESAKDFTIQNKDWSIAFGNDADAPSAIVAKKFQIMEGEAAYITGYAFLSAAEYWGKPIENTQYYVEGDDYKGYNLQATVEVTFDGVKVDSTPEDCTPEFTTPEPEPTIIELITSIAHTHDTSATCVALNGSKPYFSWHKRGTSIHGCLEAGALDKANDTFALTSWMEVNDGNTEGDNNWDGNSAVSGADENGETQGQFDYNHLIVANGKVITVGDNAKLGGFIGAITLGADGEFGTNGTLQDAFKSRQLLGKEKEKIGRSGNCVLFANGKYFIACAGGFQEYEGDIDDIFKKAKYETSSSEYWVANLGAYELTAGSAKHIAINPAGKKVATLELTTKGTHPDGDDYWFNDTKTAISAVLKVRDANDWLNDTKWAVNIGDICPIYGKNAIAMDAVGNVYVAAGKQGLLVYNNGNKVGEFSIAADVRNAGANGVAIDDNYVYVAYGVGGLYILNKSNLSVYDKYKSNAPVGYETSAAAASANYVAVDGQYIYVAYGRHGVKVLKLND